MITYHPWYHNFSPSVANKCLAEAAELGAGYIRLDIRWQDLIPDGNNVDEGAWSWSESYIKVARDWYGLQPLVVLSNPPRAVLQFTANSRLAAWIKYVDEVARRAGSLCNLYQVLNEPNNPVYRVFPSSMTAAAIVAAARVIKHHNQRAQTTINILADLWGWESNLERILRDSDSAIDIVGFDYYPGTWTVSARSDRSNWNRLSELIVKKTESAASALHGKPVAILETGYSTNMKWLRSQKQQATYFEDLKWTINQLDTRLGRGGLALVGIHELTDSDTRAFLDPEAHFGLLTSRSLQRKAGFDIVRQIFRELKLTQGALPISYTTRG